MSRRDDGMDIMLTVIMWACLGIAIAICGHGCRDTLARWTGIRQPYAEARP